jgi:tRNA-Thr(GGU) m(6)t(6)A37 methyltransferase TsaA
VKLNPIGIIHSPHRQQSGTPVQPAYAEGVQGEVVVDEQYSDGLQDIEGFERIWLVYWMDRSRPFRLKLVPYRDTVERGVFATRAPSRPNPIGISCVRLLGRQGNRLKVADLDILDGTPLLDIKPYSPRFDSYPDARSGWLDDETLNKHRADDRFE